MSPSHVATVQSIYAAFGRGDIEAILEHLADDVVWDEEGLPGVPWLAPRRGKTGAREFFQSLAAIDMHRFEVKAVIGSGDVVLGLVDVEFTVRVTGWRVRENDEVHVWRFNAENKIASFRHRVDTWQHVEAVRG